MQEVLVTAAVRTCIAVRNAVNSLSACQRSMRSKSLLKRAGDAALPDVAGEEAAWEELQRLSDHLQIEIRVIVDLEAFHRILPTVVASAGIESEPGNSGFSQATKEERHIWTYLDAVDGTVKVAGLNNQQGRLRAANDGIWAVGIAFSLPSSVKQHKDLSFSDFKVSHG